MKTVVFLRRHEYGEQFKPVMDQLGMMVLPVDADQVQSLVAWCKRERLLDQHVDMLLIDLEGTDFSTGHILTAVQNLRAYLAAEIVFLATSADEMVKLRTALAEQFRVNGFVFKDAPNATAQLKMALEGNLSPLAWTESAITSLMEEAVKTVEPYSVPLEKKITVGVAGSQARIGTTTQVFAQVWCLKKLGWKAAILDSVGDFTDMVWSFYDRDPQNVRYSTYSIINGVAFCREEEENFNAYVKDYGTLEEENAAEFGGDTLNVLVCGSKPWELQQTVKAVRLARKNSKGKLILKAAFTSKEAAKELEEVLGTLSLSSYRPDIWDSETNEEDWRELRTALREIIDEERQDDLEMDP